MDLNLVPDDLLLSWLNIEMAFDKGNMSDLIRIIRLNDHDKNARLLSYLTTRVSDDQTELGNIPQESQLKTDTLNSDITVCTSIINQLNK